METKAVVVAHWDDLVFDQRNKMYGAYQLRRHYSQRLIAGLGINVAFVVALLWWSKETFKNVSDLPGPGIVCELPIIHLTENPIIERIPKQTKSSNVKSKANLPPLVVDDPVVEEPVVQSDAVVNVEGGADTGTGEGVVEGPGSTVVDEPVVVAPPATVTIAEVMPRFGEGEEELMKYITKNVRYPRSAQRVGVEGTVFVQFVIMWDGSVQNIEIVRGIHPDCDKEAMRVISKMPRWTPASQNKKPVNVRMVLPIRFKIQ